MSMQTEVLTAGTRHVPKTTLLSNKKKIYTIKIIVKNEMKQKTFTHLSNKDIIYDTDFKCFYSHKSIFTKC